MSFILDALRKSENARQRHGGPGFAEVPIAKRQENRPLWLWAVGGLLLVNLLVLVIVLARRPDITPAGMTVTPAAAPAADTTPPQPDPTATAPAPVAPLAAEASPSATRSLEEEVGAALSGSAIAEPAVTERTSAAAAVPDRSPIVRAITPPPTTSGSTENLPTINELTGARAANMPAMHLDIHVHSSNPADRFVFINMRRYNEGDSLPEGLRVERITAEGVILDQQGFRFILPRQ